MFIPWIIHIWVFFGLSRLCLSSALPDIPLPPLPVNATNGEFVEFDLGPVASPSPTNDRPTRYGVPGTGPGGSRVTLILDWHLTKFQQRETDFMMLRALEKLVQTTIKMTKGDGPLLNGHVVFRSSSLKLTALDSVLLGGFTYNVLATAIRGLGELMIDFGANGVDVDVYVGGKKVGSMEFDFLL
ncbi:MAG: hypothetical protein Q9225_006796 [Loekoesia sp. 1 TL-2023]